jgi:hypothetical protein
MLFLISNFGRVLKSYVLFCVVPRRLEFKCQRFGKLCLFHLYRRVGKTLRTDSPMKMEQTECSKTLAFKLQTPGNNPKENIQNLML